MKQEFELDKDWKIVTTAGMVWIGRIKEYNLHFLTFKTNAGRELIFPWVGVQFVEALNDIMNVAHDESVPAAW